MVGVVVLGLLFLLFGSCHSIPINSTSLNNSTASLACSSNLRTQDIKSGKIPIRGTNLGGWLVIERWMTGGSPVWDGVPDDKAYGGEFVTMKYLTHNPGDDRFRRHRDSFITEQDFAEIAAAGLNAVRIPVGYWIVGFDNSGGGEPDNWKVFAPGGLAYLDRAIREWGCRQGVAVMISIHAAKGSQNGNDNSSPDDPGHTYWSQYPENVRNTLDVVQFLAARYKNDPAFLGIGLLNEPAGTTNEGVLKQYYLDAYGRVRNDVGSDCVLTHAPMLWQQSPGQSDWNRFTPPPNFYNVWHEWHRYQIWGFEGMTAQELINYARNQLKNDVQSWDGNWMLIGEWCLASSSSADFSSDALLKEYANAQLTAFSLAHSGWTFWTWKMYGDDGSDRNGWSLKAMIKRGFIDLNNF